MTRSRSLPAPIKIASFSGASGAGKTSLIRWLVENRSDRFRLATSLTTRQPRTEEDLPGEYEYLKEDDIQCLDEGGLLAWCLKVHENLYATSEDEIQRALRDETKITLFNVTPKTVISLRQSILKFDPLINERHVPIYVLGPPTEELERRIRDRDPSVRDEDVARRLKDCKAWDDHARAERGFRYHFVENYGLLDESVAKVLTILA